MQYFAYSQKAFVYKYVVMLCDVDQFKHMSFANYLKLMFLATDALFISCFSSEFSNINHLCLINARMQFKRQTVSGDNILIKINSTEIAEQEFSLLFTFVMEGSGELVGLGRQTYRLNDVASNEKKEVPNELKNILMPIAVNEEHLIYKY